MAGWMGRGDGHRAPFIFLSGLPGRDGWTTGTGSLMFPFWACWAGWVGRGDGSGLGSLHVSFLGSLGGMGGPRGQAPSCFLSGLAGLDGWAAVTGLGSHWIPFIFPFCISFLGSLGGIRWAAVTGLIGFPSYFLSGFPLGSLHISFLDSLFWDERAAVLGSY